jgi:tetratricopeptide (TPR) repeat protein
LLLYNYLRFDNPLEFGQRYQLAGNRQAAAQQFSLSYLWVNFRVAFLEPARWSGRFPFVHDIAVPPLPKGYSVEHPFGILSNIPLVWLALAAPLAWRGRSAEARSALRGLLAAVAVFFGVSALTLCLHNSMNVRYQVEFLPALVLLAVWGILGLERAVAGRRVWRRTTRWGWGVLLAVSALFNLFATFELYADTHVVLGRLCAKKGRTEEALVQFQKALKLQPNNPGAHNGLGTALSKRGQWTEAIAYLEEALRLEPDNSEAHNNLGYALFQLGRVPEAVVHCQEALKLQPDNWRAHVSLGSALLEQGKALEAIAHLEQALRAKPDLAGERENLVKLSSDLYVARGVFCVQNKNLAEAVVYYQEALKLQPDSWRAHVSLGSALLQQGKILEAIAHLEEALRLKPDLAKGHDKLGIALFQAGRVPEAIVHLEEALRLQPENAAAHNNLGEALLQQGRVVEAVGHYEAALRMTPGLAEAHFNLGNALVRLGKTPEAIGHYEQVLRLKPGDAETCQKLAWILATDSNATNRNVPAAVRWAERAC